MTTTETNAVQPLLGEDELLSYARDGFLKPRYRLPDEDLALLKQMTQKLLDDHPQLAHSGEPITGLHSPSYAVQNLDVGNES